MCLPRKRKMNRFLGGWGVLLRKRRDYVRERGIDRENMGI